MNNTCIGIILNNRDYKDNDALVDVLTQEYGKITFVARGVRKHNSKNATPCSILRISRFYFDYKETKGLQNLKIAEPVKNFFHIQGDLEKQAIGCLILELMDALQLDDEPAYTLLENTLQYLDSTKNPYLVLGLYLAELCRFIGIEPFVDGCVNCQSEHQIVAVSVSDGGFVCANCYNPSKHIKKDKQQLQTFRILHKAVMDQFPIIEDSVKLTFADLEDTFTFLREYSGIRMKGYKFLKEIAEM